MPGASPPKRPSPEDLALLERAVQRALEAERLGNLPIGAVIALGGEVVAEAANAIAVPAFHPGRHAEMEALARVPVALWPRAAELTCYTTLEPCVMCFGALLLHGVGRVVFGAIDPLGGAGGLLGHLPRYYSQRGRAPEWAGPVLPATCDPLYRRAAERYDGLPCGRGPSPGSSRPSPRATKRRA